MKRNHALALLLIPVVLGGCGPSRLPPAPQAVSSAVYSMNTTVAVDSRQLVVVASRAASPSELDSETARAYVPKAGYGLITVSLYLLDASMATRTTSTGDTSGIPVSASLLADGQLATAYASDSSWEYTHPTRESHSFTFDVPLDSRSWILKVSLPTETTTTVSFKIR